MMKTMKYVVLGMALTALCCKGLSASQPNCGTDRSKLVVASNFNYPPFENQVNAVLTGFDISVACELQKRLGYSQLQVANIPRAEQNAALAAGRVNLIISARSILTNFNPVTANPAAVIYANDSTAMIFNITLPGTVNSGNVLAVVNEAAGHIGVIAGTREERIADGLDNITLVIYQDYDAAIAALQKGTEIEALLLQGSVGTYAEATSRVTGSFFTNVSVPAALQTQGLGILISPDCCTLYASVRQAIADMITDGTLQSLGAKFSVPVVQPFANLTPPDCADIGPVLLARDATANFIFNKFCPCNPIIVSATTTTPPIVTAAPASTHAAVSRVSLTNGKRVAANARREAAREIARSTESSRVETSAPKEVTAEAVVADEAPANEKVVSMVSQFVTPVAETETVTVPEVVNHYPVTAATESVAYAADDRFEERTSKKSVRNREAEMRAAEQKRKAAYNARKERKESGK